MKIEEIYTRITPLNRDVTVRVMTPDGYEEEPGRRYPVLYINDGQDVFRDEETFWGAESLRFEQYYRDYGTFMPHVILVAIESPDDHGERTQQYSPYTKDFIVPPEKNFEPRIEGKNHGYRFLRASEIHYMDTGTNEYGRMTTKEEFLKGAQELYQNYLKHGVEPERIQYNIYPEAVHSQKEWRVRFPDAVRWIFQDCL